MKRFLKYLCFIAVFITLPSLANPQIINLEMPVPSTIEGKQPELEQVQKAVIWACKKRGWTPVVKGENKIEAQIIVRSEHFAEVEIKYSRDHYSIEYKSSKNLDYNESKQTIHRNYNKWVNMLSNSIQRAFSVRAQGF